MKQASEVKNVVMASGDKSVSGVDRERLAAALAAYHEAMADEGNHTDRVSTLRQRTSEVDAEINRIEVSYSRPIDYSMLSMEAVKQRSDEIMRLQSQVNSLKQLRDELQKQIKDIESDALGRFYVKSDSKREVWRTVFDGLVSQFDKESLELLIAVGSQCGKPKELIMIDLALDTSSTKLIPLMEKLGLPE